VSSELAVKQQAVQPRPCSAMDTVPLGRCAFAGLCPLLGVTLSALRCCPPPAAKEVGERV